MDIQIGFAREEFAGNFILKRVRNNLRINFFIYCELFIPILVVCLCCFFFHYVSAKFHLWPSSGDLPRPRIGMMSLVTVSPVITAFHSCCLSHHVFDQVNLYPNRPVTRLIIPIRGARGVVVIVVGNGHGDTSSNPGPD